MFYWGFSHVWQFLFRFVHVIPNQTLVHLGWTQGMMELINAARGFPFKAPVSLKRHVFNMSYVTAGCEVPSSG